MQIDLQTVLNKSLKRATVFPLVFIVFVLLILFIVFRIEMFYNVQKIQLHQIQEAMYIFLKDKKRVKELKNIALPLDAKIVLVSKEKHKVYTLQHINIDKNILYNSSFKLINNDLDIDEFKVNNTSYFLIDENLKLGGYNIFIVIKKSNALKAIFKLQDSSSKLIGTLLLIFLLSLLLVFLYSKREFKKLSKYIIEPIIDISKLDIEFIQKAKEFPKTKSDILEINDLYINLSQLMQDLKIKNSELESFNEKLQQEVEKATVELKQNNQKLQENMDSLHTIFDLTMEMIVITYKNKIVDVNQSGLKMLGYNSIDDVKNRDIDEFIVPEDMPKVYEALKLNSIEPYEVTLIKADGSFLYAYATGKNIIRDNLTFRISTLIDITEIKEQENRLFQQSKLAQMGEMVSMIAHQWRQPLNALSAAAIKLELKNQLNKLEKEDIATTSKFIQQMAQKLSQTINDFLNFTKPNSHVEELNLDTLFEDILNIIKAQLDTHNIEIEIKNDTNLKIVSKKQELMHILMNLITNARDALDEKDIENKKITIEVSQDNDAILIDVKDNAGGVPEELLNRIFEPYFTTKLDKDGTGLGLYMSKELASKHLDGDLSVKNIDGGAIFRLRIKNLTQV